MSGGARQAYFLPLLKICRSPRRSPRRCSKPPPVHRSARKAVRAFWRRAFWNRQSTCSRSGINSGRGKRTVWMHMRCWNWLDAGDPLPAPCHTWTILHLGAARTRQTVNQRGLAHIWNPDNHPGWWGTSLGCFCLTSAILQTSLQPQNGLPVSEARLSSELLRLSPSTKMHPSGTVTGNSTS